MIQRSLITCLLVFQATLSIAQQVSTDAASNLGLTQASLNGRATAGTTAMNVSFEWGTTTTYGNTAVATPSVVQPSVPTTFTGTITGLSPSTTYHYRAVGSNTTGPVYGQDIAFTTPASSAPYVGSNGIIHGRGDLFATFYADINPNNSATTVALQYGTTTSYGQTGDVTPNSIPAGLYFVSVSARINNLLPFEVYHYRWVCTNSAGVTNGGDRVFNTNGVSVNNISGAGFRLYPNPANDFINLELPGAVADYKISVTDVTGRYVTVPAVAIGQKLQLELSNLPYGAYTLTIIGGDQRYTQVIMKQ